MIEEQETNSSTPDQALSTARHRHCSLLFAPAKLRERDAEWGRLNLRISFLLVHWTRKDAPSDHGTAVDDWTCSNRGWRLHLGRRQDHPPRRAHNPYCGMPRWQLGGVAVHRGHGRRRSLPLSREPEPTGGHLLDRGLNATVRQIHELRRE